MDALIDSLTVNGQSLNFFMAKHQRIYLNVMLGKNLAEAFLNGISNENPEQIWIELRDRLTFEIDGIKQSPIANYVYFYIMRYGVTKTSYSGEKKSKSDYSENRSSAPKSIFAWNDMVRMNIDFREWFDAHIHLYEPYMGESAHDFMMSEDYEDLFTCINAFNI
jgi:hypothetical protein